MTTKRQRVAEGWDEFFREVVTPNMAKMPPEVRTQFLADETGFVKLLRETFFVGAGHVIFEILPDLTSSDELVDVVQELRDSLLETVLAEGEGLQ